MIPCSRQRWTVILVTKSAHLFASLCIHLSIFTPNKLTLCMSPITINFSGKILPLGGLISNENYLGNMWLKIKARWNGLRGIQRFLVWQEEERNLWNMAEFNGNKCKIPKNKLCIVIRAKKYPEKSEWNIFKASVWAGDILENKTWQVISYTDKVCTCNTATKKRNKSRY